MKKKKQTRLPAKAGILVALNWHLIPSGSPVRAHAQTVKQRASATSSNVVLKVGLDHHLEYWILAEDLADMNRHIVGEIELVNTFK